MPVTRSRKARRLVAGVTALALGSAVAVVLLPGAAAAAVTPQHESTSSPIEETIPNACTVGEDIEFSGTNTLTTARVVHPEGRIDFVAHQNLHATGTGSFGNRYNFSTQSNTSLMLTPDIAPNVATFIGNGRVIGQGGATSLQIHVTSQVTINANGEIIASTHKLSSECK